MVKGVLKTHIEATSKGNDMSENAVEVGDESVGSACTSEDERDQILINLSPVEGDPVIVGKHTQEQHCTSSISGYLLAEFLQKLANAVTHDGSDKRSEWHSIDERDWTSIFFFLIFLLPCWLRAVKHLLSM